MRKLPPRLTAFGPKNAPSIELAPAVDEPGETRVKFTATAPAVPQRATKQAWVEEAKGRSVAP